MKAPVLVDKFEEVVEVMRNGKEIPYYMYGHRLEIANRLLEQDSNKKRKYKKYPLVALRLDTEEMVADGLVRYNLNVAILQDTDQVLIAPERYQKVFKPILYPLYESFMGALLQTGFFWEADTQYPPHTKIDRPYWGNQDIIQKGVAEGNVKNIFNDPIDAIEIVNLKVNLYIDC